MGAVEVSLLAGTVLSNPIPDLADRSFPLENPQDNVGEDPSSTKQPMGGGPFSASGMTEGTPHPDPPV